MLEYKWIGSRCNYFCKLKSKHPVTLMVILQVMAQVIEEKTGADRFSIILEEPYDIDYSTMLPKAIAEENNEHPALKKKLIILMSMM
jgi:hypothetical protein